MSIFLSGAKCPACGTHEALEMEAEESAHDEQLIDVVVTCTECYAVFNSFININEMEQQP
jgi:Zn ribbon nucleic-acid-binding protein